MALRRQQEIFAQEVAKGGTQADAYRKAYPKSLNWKDNIVWIRACELMKNGNVSVRVAELQAEYAENNKITVKTLLTELEEARKLALESGQPAPAVSATMGKAKLLGMDKQIIDHTNSDGTLKAQAPTTIIINGVDSDRRGEC